MQHFSIILMLCVSGLAGLAQADLAGASDPVGLPRVAGAQIIGARSSAYDLGLFLSSNGGNKLEVTTAEGAHHRVLYLLPNDVSSIAAQKNYQVALEELGAVEEVYRCLRDCDQHALSTTLWTRDNLVDTPGHKNGLYMLGFRHVYRNGAYRYAQVQTEDALLSVGVFSATPTESNLSEDVRERTLVLVDVIVEETFAADLELVDADEMIEQINDTGAIALYGIQFDSAKAALKPESEETLVEITAALAAAPELALYVVGHTDDSGALDYNQTLSQRRADTVVAALVDAGVAAKRVTAVGVGPVAPKAPNSTDAGRALNRRVELVKRAVE